MVRFSVIEIDNDADRHVGESAFGEKLTDSCDVAVFLLRLSRYTGVQKKRGLGWVNTSMSAQFSCPCGMMHTVWLVFTQPFAMVIHFSVEGTEDR